MITYTNSKLQFLEQFPLFNVLNEAEMKQLLSMVEFKTKSRYSFIYQPEEDSNCVFFLVKGTLKIGTHSSDGREVIKNILHPMSMFGELCLVGEQKRQDFARVMNEELHYFALKVEHFQLLMQANHQLCVNILQMIGKRLVNAECRLESLIFKDARTRIIEFLKESADKRGRRVGYEMLVKHSLTQQDIANLTGTSRQTVTPVLNDLRKSDLIYFNRKSILIRDMTRLE